MLPRIHSFSLSITLWFQHPRVGRFRCTSSLYPSCTTANGHIPIVHVCTPAPLPSAQVVDAVMATIGGAYEAAKCVRLGLRRSHDSDISFATHARDEPVYAGGTASSQPLAHYDRTSLVLRPRRTTHARDERTT
jgi:hypothetical protein